MTNIYVKPATPGALIRQPDRGMAPLPDEGALVVDSEFWRRRIMHGDVVEAAPPEVEHPGPLPFPNPTIKPKG